MKNRTYANEMKEKILSEKPVSINPLVDEIVTSYNKMFRLGDPANYEPDPKDSFFSNSTYECSDCGAFYVERSWSQRGNVARYNTFNSIYSTEKLGLSTSRLQTAFYLDDQMSGWDFYGNIISNSSVGILLGGGRRNNIHHNYFINNNNNILFDNRGMIWEQSSCSINGSFHKELLSLNYFIE